MADNATKITMNTTQNCISSRAAIISIYQVRNDGLIGNIKYESEMKIICKYADIMDKHNANKQI